MAKLIAVDEAAKLVKSGDRVVLGMMTQPKAFIEALIRRKDELRNVTVFSHFTDPFDFLEPGMEESFNIQAAFVTMFTRKGVADKRIDFASVLLGTSNAIRQTDGARTCVYHYADVYVGVVSPPNKNGYCSFGHAVWYSPLASRTAKLAIGEVQPNLPWTYGESIHVSELDYLIEGSSREKVLTLGGGLKKAPEDEAFMSEIIAAQTASLIKDGDTIEIGIGTASEMTMGCLKDKNDLGIESEMTYASMVDLMKAGNITGKRKNVNQGKAVSSCFFLWPDDPRNDYALTYIDQNPSFEFYDMSYVMSVPRIAANDNQVSINSAIAIDLTGQVIIDHLGTNPISGPGGQVEFAIGAHYSRGGRAITVLPSTALRGTVSRIVPQFEAGAVVHIPDFYVDYLVTDQGIVNLSGKSRRQKAEAIISVAHPDFQAELTKAARKLFYP